MSNEVSNEVIENEDRVVEPVVLGPDDLKSSLTPEELEKIKEESRKLIGMARQHLLIRFPFTGSILLRLNCIPVRDARLNTACTDGTNIFFDIDFFKNLNNRQRLFVLAHEVWHVVMMTFLRCKGRDHELFNQASDMEINHILQNARFSPPTSVLFPPAGHEDESAEELYELLKQNQQESENGNGDGDGSGSNKKNGGADGKSGNQDSQNNSDGGISGQFDKHQYAPKNEPTPEEIRDLIKNQTSDSWGQKGIDSDYRATISKDIADKIRQKVVAAAQQYERTKGNLPGDIAGLINAVRQPEIRWQEALAQFVTSCNKGERSWLPPNRRYVHQGLYLPSEHGHEIKCTVAIDTSGSTQNDLPKFMSELISLLQTFKNYEIDLIHCDCNIQKIEHFDKYEALDIEDAINNGHELYGGGGTSFQPVIDHMLENPTDTNRCLIYFTDSYGDVQKEPPPFPVLWVLTSDGKDNFCDWGVKIKFKKDKYEDDNKNIK